MIAGDASDDIIDKFRKDVPEVTVDAGTPTAVIKVYDSEGNLVE
jgi:hypothetical protein